MSVAEQGNNQPVMPRREFLEAFALAGIGLVVPRGAAGVDARTQLLDAPDLNEIVVPPGFETLRAIVNDSLDTKLLTPFLRQMYARLSQNPYKYFGRRYELGSERIPRQVVYSYSPNGGDPVLNLYIGDPGRNESAPSQYILELQFGKNVRATLEGQTDEILLEAPNLFTEGEQIALLGLFKSTPEMEEQLWFPRLEADGIPGITRGFYDDDGSLYNQDATVLGRATLRGVYPLLSKSASVEDARSPIGPEIPII